MQKWKAKKKIPRKAHISRDGKWREKKKNANEIVKSNAHT